jgi:malate/lactate dehydrogenase
MESVKLAVMGAGSVRCTVPVLATLATYFGERPLEVALYDADEERLDLFDRFARTIFVANNNQHTVTASAEYEEVAEGADKMILQVGPNCAAKQLKKDRGRQNIPADEALTATLDSVAFLLPFGLAGKPQRRSATGAAPSGAALDQSRGHAVRALPHL